MGKFVILRRESVRLPLVQFYMQHMHALNLVSSQFVSFVVMSLSSCGLVMSC